MPTISFILLAFAFAANPANPATLTPANPTDPKTPKTPPAPAILRLSRPPQVTRLDSRGVADEEDLRTAIRQRLKKTAASGSSVLDLGCGTGFSTTVGGVGVDKCDAAIRIARLLHPKKRFIRDDASTFGGGGFAANGSASFKAVTLVHVLEECEQEERIKILHNACRLAKHVIVVGPDPAEKAAMLSPLIFKGNDAPTLPTLHDYFTWIELDIADVAFIHDRFVSTTRVGAVVINELRDRSLVG